MTFSPQRLEELLAWHEAKQRAKAPTTFMESALQSSFSAEPAREPPSPPPFRAPLFVAPAAERPEPAEKPQVETRPPDESFESALGLPAKASVHLPSGAKNVKCHTIERDPDSGRITKVYTYDVGEPVNGD